MSKANEAKNVWIRLWLVQAQSTWTRYVRIAVATAAEQLITALTRRTIDVFVCFSFRRSKTCNVRHSFVCALCLDERSLFRSEVNATRTPLKRWTHSVVFYRSLVVRLCCISYGTKRHCTRYYYYYFRFNIFFLYFFSSFIPSSACVLTSSVLYCVVNNEHVAHLLIPFY